MNKLNCKITTELEKKVQDKKVEILNKFVRKLLIRVENMLRSHRYSRDKPSSTI